MTSGGRMVSKKKRYIGKNYLSAALGTFSGFGKARAGEILELIADCITAKLMAGEPITLPSIGTIYPIPEKEKRMFSVRRQEEVMTFFRPNIKIRISKALRKKLKGLKEVSWTK